VGCEGICTAMCESYFIMLLMRVYESYVSLYAITNVSYEILVSLENVFVVSKHLYKYVILPLPEQKAR
jgi:hypothetical protein